MADKTVLWEREGPVALVQLNRPEKHHAINREMSSELEAVFRQLDADESVLAIVLTGSGDKAFCAGADMSERTESMRDEEQTPAAAEARADGLAAVAGCSKPVIAAINGYAYGGGARLAVSTDIRIASPTARIRFAAAGYGTIACCATLPQLIGPARAKEVIFSTRVVEADEAERIGLVNRVVPQDQLIATAMDLANQIAASSPDAVRWAKKVIDAAADVDAAESLEAEANRSLRASRQHQERFTEAAERVTGRGSR